MIGIYKITNKFNGKVYIGQSIDIFRRWEEHKYYSEKIDTVLHKAFVKYGISNFIFEIIEECSKEELDDKERYWIKYYNSFGKDGYNMTPGGQESPFLVNEKDIISLFNQKISIRQISEILGYSRVTIRNVLDRNNISYIDSSIPIGIVMINPYTLEEIKTFSSIVDAANYVKISEAAIRKALKNKTYYSGGYYWKKISDNTKLIPLKPGEKRNNTKSQRVGKYDSNNNLIEEYESLSKANNALGKSRSSQLISKACKGERNSAYGYIWKYID